MRGFSWILFFICFYSANVLSQTKKWGILIGVSKYAPSSKIKPLSSHNDLVLMDKALKNIGFTDNDIIVLEDSNATQEKIKFLLEKKILPELKKGDFVYFHFSGHGQQMYDDNADEYDGLDEAILPYDAQMNYKKGQLERHLRDDYLGWIFSKMQIALGGTGQLLVCLDACHSGTGTRGVIEENLSPVARGTALIYGEPPSTGSLQKETENSDTNFGLTSNADDKATMISFFGASPQELNYEYWSKEIKAGSLSYALFKALSNYDKGISFKDLFMRIKATMAQIAPLQAPQAEGPLNKLMFSNGMTKPSTFFVATGNIKDKKIQINAGNIDGVSDSSIFSIRKQLPNRTLIEVARASVIDRGLAYSEVFIDTNLQNDSISQLKFYLLNKIKRFETDINIAQAAQWKNIIHAASDEDYNLTTTLSPAPFTLKEVQEKNGKLLSLYNRQGLLQQWNLQAKPIDQIQLELQKKIRKIAWVQSIRQLNTQESDAKISAELWILPFDTITKKPKLDQPIRKVSDFNTPLTLGPEFCYKIHIKNETAQKLYYSIIDIQPDEIANFLVPYGNEMPSSFIINPYESVDFPGFDYYLEIGPPAGKETLKLVGSTLPIDFSGMSTKGNTKNSNLSSSFIQTIHFNIKL